MSFFPRVVSLCTVIATFTLSFLPLPTAAQDPVIYPSRANPDYPFSEAVHYNGVLYLSGTLGSVDGKLVPGGIVPESRQTMDNIQTTLAHHDLSFADVIKCTVFLADIAEWPAFNEVYAEYFAPGQFPARSALAAKGLALNARVEVECLAAKPGPGASEP